MLISMKKLSNNIFMSAHTSISVFIHVMAFLSSLIEQLIHVTLYTGATYPRGFEPYSGNYWLITALHHLAAP